MRLVKGISLFIIYPLLLLGLGFYAGVKATRFFYPGDQNPKDYIARADIYSQEGGQPADPLEGASGGTGIIPDEPVGREPVVNDASSPGTQDGVVVEAAFVPETLNVDTEYIVEEMDVFKHSSVENVSRLPSMYVGMDREQFLEAMDTYEMSPPLSELELGFAGVDVLSFSRERVVIRKNYKLLGPDDSFYLAVYNNEVVVYLEDKETIFFETKIPLESLPSNLQKEIMGMKWVENEEKLYNFLENYSS